MVKSHNLLVSGFKEGGEGKRDERKNVVRDNKYQFHYCQSITTLLVIMKIDYEIFIIQPTSFGLVLVIAVSVSQELHQVLASFRQAPLGDS